jgi:hypothetical protein
MSDLTQQKKYAAGIGAGAILAGLVAISQHRGLDCSLKARCQRTIEAAGAESRCVLKYDGADKAKACIEAIARGLECAQSSKARECSSAIDAAYQTERAMCPAIVDVKACTPWRGFDSDGNLAAIEGDGK